MNDDNHSQVNTVSAIVVCFNEEERIGDCLESLRWCDEIVVVDSFSTDRTPEICRGYTDRFIQREWAGYRDQKAFAHSQATKDWVFLVDSDERVTAELRNEVEDALVQDNGRYAGYAVPRLVHYLDRWWHRGGWYPDYDVRLFRRARLGAVPSRMKRFSSTARCAACAIPCIIILIVISKITCSASIGSRRFHHENRKSRAAAGA